MLIQDRQRIRGKTHIKLMDKYGNIIQEFTKYNTITNAMDANIAGFASGSGSAIGYIAVGTGSGQGASDTGLATSLSRVALTSTTQGTGGDDNDVTYVGDWPAGTGTGALTEAGLFLTDDNTSMMAYQDFSAINKSTDMVFQINWTLTFGAS